MASPSKGGRLSTGGKVGIALGAAATVVLFATLVLTILVLRKRSRKGHDNGNCAECSATPGSAPKAAGGTSLTSNASISIEPEHIGHPHHEVVGADSYGHSRDFSGRELTAQQEALAGANLPIYAPFRSFQTLAGPTSPAAPSVVALSQQEVRKSTERVRQPPSIHTRERTLVGLQQQPIICQQPSTYVFVQQQQQQSNVQQELQRESMQRQLQQTSIQQQLQQASMIAFKAATSRGQGEVIDVIKPGQASQVVVTEKRDHGATLDQIDQEVAALEPGKQEEATGQASDTADSPGGISGGAAKSWAIPREDIIVNTLPDGSHYILGRGGFGTVYRATWKGVEVAVKQFHALVDEELVYALRKEFAVLHRLHSAEGIVGLLGLIDDPVAPAIVLEYCEGGDLRHALANDYEDEYRWSGRGRSIAIQVIKALMFMHTTAGVIHRDVKSSNVLLKKDGQAKLADVGLSKILSDTAKSSAATLGTFAYAAPELLLGRQCTNKVDIYSFGVLCYEICTKTAPVRGHINFRDSQPNNGDGAGVPPAVSTCIGQCMSDNPSERPTAEQLLKILMAT